MSNMIINRCLETYTLYHSQYQQCSVLNNKILYTKLYIDYQSKYKRKS